MDKQESTKTYTTSAETAAAIDTITNPMNVVSRPIRRILQNFLLVWLDTNFDETEKDFKKSLQQLRHVVASIATFTDAQECIDFLSKIETEKVFLIVSDYLAKQIIPEIETWPQLESIYVLCGNQSAHQQWLSKIPKVKGIHTKIEPICNALQIDRKMCDRSMISISVDGVDALFMYTQLLKETFLEIEDDDTKSMEELINYCRLQDDIPENQIDKVESEYRSHTPIWWYTGPHFIYSMLNRALRLMDVDIILKTGFFIRHLHQDINNLYHEQQEKTTSPFQVYRGQGLSMQEFQKIKENKGRLMSFNNFLSTSRNRTLSLEIYAQSTAIYDPNLIGILFIMTIDPILCKNSSIPYADVSKVGFFKDAEEETLFTTHTIFRIDEIQRIDDKQTDKLWQINLTLQGNDNHQLNNLTAHLREELNSTTGWSRLGAIIIKLGEPAKAEHLYKILLENTSCSDEDQASYSSLLGRVYDDMGEYSKAHAYYEKDLDISKTILPPNHPDLATSYNNIGLVYYKMGEYSKALSSFEQALEIRKIVLPPNHSFLANSYNNIGSVYDSRADYAKSLSYYEQALEIRKIALPPNHPNLAQSYNNIGSVYDDMGEYSKALSYYERALEIQKIALPTNHSDLATSYNNIGLVYYNMGEYSKALSSHERSFEIRRIALPSNHPNIATSYNNIGLVYNIMGEYSKALSSHERALEIWKIALPPNHPDLAATYNNIGTLYDNIGEYSKALSSHERSLEILKIALPSNHPDLAKPYDNIGLVYNSMGEYSKALSSYEQSLEIQKRALPPNHPDLAATYNNIGAVYDNMGEYSKALSYYEKAGEIWQKSLHPNHPHNALVKKHIDNVKKKL